jgi:nucleotide sugar dehydrogenase
MKFTSLLRKINSKKAVAGVLGLGFTGRELAKQAALSGFKTIGFDIDIEKVESIKINKRFVATGDFKRLGGCDVICVCVQTPLRKKLPNLEYLRRAVASIAENINLDTLIIIESSVPVGTIRNIVLPVLSKSEKGFKVFLGYSPERLDEGNKKFNITNIPKIVAGVDNDSLKLTKSFYQKIVEQIVEVSTVEAAEMSKIFENTFRFVNISLVNELSEYASSKGVNFNEVIRAAATKPFGFLTHNPGIGIGGNCIPVLPYYLFSHGNERDLTIVKSAALVNEGIPEKIVNKAMKILKSVKNPQVLLVGVGYKPNSVETRNSPAIEIWDLLEDKEVEVFYHDPGIPIFRNRKSIGLTVAEIEKYDLVLITTPHKKIDYRIFSKVNIPVLDSYGELL